MTTRWCTPLLLMSLSVACAAGDDRSLDAGPWAGTTSTAGDVTTVVTESGSVWGGAAELAEDLSIGVETGDDPYMFGPIVGLAATNERIYVADDSRFAVRVYDHDGNHLFDIGREGEGPGEFDHINALAVDPDGRVLVQGGARVNVFDLDGNYLEAWPYRHAGGQPLTVAADGTAFVPARWTENDERYRGLIEVGPDGGERRRIVGPDYDTTPWGLIARGGGRTTAALVLHAPRAVWGALPSGAIVEGISDAYHFTVRRRGGDSMVVVRDVDLPPVPPAHAEWFILHRTIVMQRVQPDWRWTANPVPDTKPAFASFFGDRHGRIWVTRPRGTYAVTECDPDPRAVSGRVAASCWRDAFGFDVFDEASGRFLGAVNLPHAPRFPVFLRDSVLLVQGDRFSTIMVKRYRLQIPD